MVLGLFRRKKEVEGTIFTQNSLDILNQNVRLAFTRVKSDIQVIRDWLDHLKDRDNDNEMRLRQMESKIEELGEVISYTQMAIRDLKKEVDFTPRMSPQNLQEHPVQKLQNQLPELQEKPILMPPLSQNSQIHTPQTQSAHQTIELLTDTQKVILFRLATLVREAGSDWIPLKNLAGELYPNREYGAVRSTLSEYLSLMEEQGLITKKRKGKHAFASLTEKGKKHFEELKIPTKSEAKSR